MRRNLRIDTAKRTGLERTPFRRSRFSRAARGIDDAQAVVECFQTQSIVSSLGHTACFPSRDAVLRHAATPLDLQLREATRGKPIKNFQGLAHGRHYACLPNCIKHFALRISA